MAYPCKQCGQVFDDLITMARHVRDFHPKVKSKQQIIDPSLPPDKKLLSGTSDLLIEDLRKEYLVRRYVKLLNELETPQQPQQPPQNVSTRFHDFIELMKALKEQTNGTNLNDMLKQIQTLKEFENALSPQEPESMEDTLIKEGLKAFMQPKQPSQPQPLPQPLPQPMPITESQNVVYENQPEQSFSDVVSELLTDKAKQIIKLTPKNLAYGKIKDFINLTEEEFNEVYDKIKSEK